MFEVQHASPRVGSIIRTTKQDMVKGTYAKEINELLTQRSALVFPQMHLTIEEQLAFAGTIGKVFLVGGKDVQKISMDPEINPGCRLHPRRFLLAHRRRQRRCPGKGDDAQLPHTRRRGYR